MSKRTKIVVDLEAYSVYENWRDAPLHLHFRRRNKDIQEEFDLPDPSIMPEALEARLLRRWWTWHYFPHLMDGLSLYSFVHKTIRPIARPIRNRKPTTKKTTTKKLLAPVAVAPLPTGEVSFQEVLKPDKSYRFEQVYALCGVTADWRMVTRIDGAAIEAFSRGVPLSVMGAQSLLVAITLLEPDKARVLINDDFLPDLTTECWLDNDTSVTEDERNFIRA